MEKKLKGIIVSHTHWDRAWYWTFQQYRVRLIQILDQLINILKTDENYKSFTFDGQTVILEDYLEIKPENEEILKNLISQKRMFVGPWYILPDEFLVSGESLVRNLMLGHKIAGKFGNIMKEGYVPDPFGHIENLPQILNGFGIDSFIFSRGISKETSALGTEFYWESPDGSKVLAINQRNSYCHLASWGYKALWGDFSKEKPNFKLAYDRIRKEIKTLKQTANTNILLFTNGCDHLPAQPEIPKIIDYVSKKLKDIELKHGNFSDLVKLIKDSDTKFEKYKGELIGNALNFILLGVYSARTYLKQMNNYNQNLYEKYVEPLAAISKNENGEDYSRHIWTGWKLILKNHPHDDICGSGIDEIHSDMVNRFDQASQLGSLILRNSFNDVSLKINTAQKPGKPFIVFNPNNWNVTDKLNFDILFELDDPLIKKFKILDNEGKEVSFVVLDSKHIMLMEILKEAKYHKVNIEMLCKNIPSCGYKTYYIVQSNKLNNITQLNFNNSAIENEFFKVKALKNGTLEILDKQTGRIYNECNLFEDTEDIGDEYTYSYSRFSETITNKNINAKIEIIDRRPVSISLKISFNLPIPEGIQPNRQKRSLQKVNLQVISYITLTEGVNRIDVSTEINNIAKDHRLRVLFPSSIISEKCDADGHFNVVTRDSYYNEKPTFNKKFEYYSTRHNKAFVSVSDKEFGLTIANKGLPEYEIISGKNESVIALTLFRSVGWLSRDDLITRLGNAGPMIETPGAQCLGNNKFEYSIIPHQKNWFDSKAYLSAYQFNTPLIGQNVKKHEGILKDSHSFIRIKPEQLIISAIKSAESGNGMIVRFYNIANENVNGYIYIYKKIKNVTLTNLNEDRIRKIEIYDNNSIELEVEPFKICTLHIEF